MVSCKLKGFMHKWGPNLVIIGKTFQQIRHERNGFHLQWTEAKKETFCMWLEKKNTPKRKWNRSVFADLEPVVQSLTKFNPGLAETSETIHLHTQEDFGYMVRAF